jgi:cell division protein FtsB
VLFLVTRSDFRVLVLNALEIKRLQKEDKRLDSEYSSLNQEYDQLLKSDDYLEKTARTELNMTKPGEIEYRFDPAVKKDDKKKANKNAAKEHIGRTD